MNKYMGFFELKALNVPSVPWDTFTSDTVLDKELLWTIRVATAAGNDLNLPRAVGVDSEEAQARGRELLREYGEKGIVIYYPYFIAEKSGVLDINSQRLVIEAVDKDLWNLVTYGRKDVTVIVRADGDMQMTGDSRFLTPDEISELMRFGAVIRGRFRGRSAEAHLFWRNGAMRTTPISAGNRSGKGTLCFMNLGFERSVTEPSLPDCLPCLKRDTEYESCR